MSHHPSFNGLTVLVLAATVAGGTLSWARADTTARQAATVDHRVSLTLDQADVRGTLKGLFDSAGLNYAIGPDVNGTVTAVLKDLPLKSALQNVIKASSTPLTCRVVKGVYSVNARQRDPLPPTDNHVVAVTDTLISMRTTDADLRGALEQLFGMAGQDYVLAPDVQGKVSVAIADAPFKSALDEILDSAPNVSVTVQDGVYLVTAKSRAADSLRQSPRKVTMHLDHTDVHTALRLLFQSADANFTLAANVTGRITVGLNDVPLSAALTSLVGAADMPLSYHVEHGVYNVSPVTEETPAPETDAAYSSYGG